MGAGQIHQLFTSFSINYAIWDTQCPYNVHIGDRLRCINIFRNNMIYILMFSHHHFLDIKTKKTKELIIYEFIYLLFKTLKKFK